MSLTQCHRSCATDTTKTVPQVGDELLDSLNSCRSLSCELGDGNRVEKLEKLFTCDESCADGWVYEPSPLHPQVCCGGCEQVGLGRGVGLGGHRGLCGYFQHVRACVVVMQWVV